LRRLLVVGVNESLALEAGFLEMITHHPHRPEHFAFKD
jgi:hypothetical protein